MKIAQALTFVSIFLSLMIFSSILASAEEQEGHSRSSVQGYCLKILRSAVGFVNSHEELSSRTWYVDPGRLMFSLDTLEDLEGFLAAPLDNVIQEGEYIEYRWEIETRTESDGGLLLPNPDRQIRRVFNNIRSVVCRADSETNVIYEVSIYRRGVETFTVSPFYFQEFVELPRPTTQR